MDGAHDDCRCGLCGQHEEPQVGGGRRVEYVVVEIRGATAHYQAADDSSGTFKTGADFLSRELGIDQADLLGRHYSCWVTPTEYGVIENRFELS
ncbi:hypothetical protein [Streptomyces sp. NPDC093225]|uniref:hypothetical protein n=1 Tax=Streptomyces sp. NPDC093225 TaxID=3366034 RepID=UPI003817C23D